MKHRSIIGITVALLLVVLISIVATTETLSAQSAPDIEEFRIIWDRNIFDPNRTASFNDSGDDGGSYETPMGDRLVLLGVMIDGGEAVAFFDGSPSELGGNIELGGEIVGYRIVSIRTDYVKLAKGDQRIKIAVGAGLIREGEGEWEPSEGPLERVSNIVDTPEVNDDPAPTSSSSDETNTESGDSSDDDVLRRMMERRNQELEQ